MKLSGVVVEGHRVASGLNRDPRFPGGTIAMQVPHFLERGVDLRRYHPATLNVSVAPHVVRLTHPTVTVRELRWHPSEPAEDFSFAECTIHAAGSTVGSMIYWPHPDTKPEHFQSPDVVELLAPWVEGIGYGDDVVLEFADHVLRIS